MLDRIETLLANERKVEGEARSHYYSKVIQATEGIGHLERIRQMVQVHVWPRLVADLRDIELEGPGNEDLSSSRSII